MRTADRYKSRTGGNCMEVLVALWIMGLAYTLFILAVMSGARFRWLFRFLVALIAFCAIECKSTSLPERTVQAGAKLESIKSDADAIDAAVDSSNMTQQQKDEVKSRTSNIRKNSTDVKAVVVEQGTTIVDQSEDIEDLEGYKKLVIGFCIAAGLAIAAGLWFGVKWWLKRRAGLA